MPSSKTTGTSKRTTSDHVTVDTNQSNTQAPTVQTTKHIKSQTTSPEAPGQTGESSSSPIPAPTGPSQSNLLSSAPSNNPPSSATVPPAGSQQTQAQGTIESDDMGYSTGALAGAIVGSVLGAAIITFLITWLFTGRRRQQRKDEARRDRGNDTASSHKSVRGAAAAAAVAEKPSSRTNDTGVGWQAYLPQSADDRTIQNAVKTLFDQIELHVDNYYGKSAVEPDSRTRQALGQLDTSKLPASINELITNTGTTLPVIKHSVAKLLITRMSPSPHANGSLLPAYLSVAPSKLQTSSISSGESTAAQQAYSQWRLLNSFLHPRPEEDPGYVHRRDKAVGEIENELTAAFAPWQADPRNAESLKQHEKGLAMRASSVGVLIMSQPSAYEFKWATGQDTSRSTSGRSLIVLPGFWKTTDDHGKTLESPQLLVSPVITRI